MNQEKIKRTMTRIKLLEEIIIMSKDRDVIVDAMDKINNLKYYGTETSIRESWGREGRRYYGGY